MKKLLEVRDLTITLKTQTHEFTPIEKISFDLFPGEILGILGESGSGKTLTALSLLQLLPPFSNASLEGQILFEGENLLEKTEKELQQVRGKKIGLIFQDPLSSLNPTMKIGKQILEALLLSKKLSKKEALQKVLDLLKLVGIQNPLHCIEQYPHQLSGGMRQRVCIAIACSQNPKLLIADEPTTALDVTVQSQILSLFQTIRNQTNMSILLISHDLGVLAHLCDRVLVLFAGKIIERGTFSNIYKNPLHPYTKLLFQAAQPQAAQQHIAPHEPTIKEEISSLGCPFAERCSQKKNLCLDQVPPEKEKKQNHFVSCWNHDE